MVRLAYTTTSALATLTVVTSYLVVSAPQAPLGLHGLSLALGAATCWWHLAWLLGYHPATPEEVERISSGVLWHRTQARAWSDGFPKPGQTITVSPRPDAALMFSRSGLKGPRRAFYASRLQPHHPAVWAIPRPRADSVLLVLLPRDLGAVHLRGDGAVAIVEPGASPSPPRWRRQHNGCQGGDSGGAGDARQLVGAPQDPEQRLVDPRIELALAGKLRTIQARGHHVMLRVDLLRGRCSAPRHQTCLGSLRNTAHPVQRHPLAPDIVTLTGPAQVPHHPGHLHNAPQGRTRCSYR
jgi:hypothetical protein